MLPQKGTDERPGPVFAALADATRRRIVRELAAQGPLTPTSLGARAGISRQGAAQHLAVLEAAGLARARRIGREVRYTLDPGPFEDAEGWMRTIAASWTHRRTVLDRRSEGSAGPAGEGE